MMQVMVPGDICTLSVLPYHLSSWLCTQAGGFGSNHQDIASARYAPLLFGITSFCASMAGSVGVLLVGYMLDIFQSWNLAFVVIAAVNLGAAVLFQLMSSSELQFE